MPKPKSADHPKSAHPQARPAADRAADSRHGLAQAAATAQGGPFGNGLADAGPKRSQKQAGQALADPQDAAPEAIPDRSGRHAE